MREAPVEKHLTEGVQKLTGLCIKLLPASMVGLPDRIVLLPRGTLWFVELKRPKGGVLSAMQGLAHKHLRRLGFTVLVLSTKEEIDAKLKEWKENNGRNYARGFEEKHKALGRERDDRGG